MKKFEYKTVTMQLKGEGLFGWGIRKAEGFDEALNEQGAQGWRYVDTLSETEIFTGVDRIKLIFEKEIG